MKKINKRKMQNLAAQRAIRGRVAEEGFLTQKLEAKGKKRQTRKYLSLLQGN